MDLAQFLVQTLNGIQYGLLLFLVASGLTLIFGIMGIINLAHGAFYMIGAYLAYWLAGWTDNLFLAIILGLPITVTVGLIVERLAISPLYRRNHLDQVLLTFGLILILNETQRIIWGSDFHAVPVPETLSGSVRLTENQVYPVYPAFHFPRVSRRRGGAVLGHHPHAARHDDPRRRVEPRNGGGFRRKHPRTVHGHLRDWCRPCRLLRNDRVANKLRLSRYGRQGADCLFRRRRDRWHRIRERGVHRARYSSVWRTPLAAFSRRSFPP